jgi:hypothetical protein
MSPENKRITIDVLIDGDEISGQACDGEGQPTLFIGWLGLIWVLDGLLGLGSPAAAGEATS